MQAPHLQRFLPVFLLSFTILTESLALYLLRSLNALPGAYWWYTAALLALLTLLMARGLFPADSRMRREKQTAACLLALAVTAGSCAGVYASLSRQGSTYLLQGATPPDTAALIPFEEPFVMYLGGSDSRTATLTESRCDVNILAAVNPNTMQLLLVNTPRDTYLANPAGRNAKDKLTHCGLYGMENSMGALSALYKQPVHYGAVINFTGFANLIDALGGVTVYSDTAYTTSVGSYPIAQGENQLNGAQALAFARERYHLTGGDSDRGKNQMQVISAMLQQLSPRQLLTNWQDILANLDGMLSTNFPLPLMTRLASAYLPRHSQWEIYSVSLTGTDGTASTYSASAKSYVMVPDANSVEAISALMGKILTGECLSPSDFP